MMIIEKLNTGKSSLEPFKRESILEDKLKRKRMYMQQQKPTSEAIRFGNKNH